LIWLALVAVVFVGGGAWLVARTWRTRGIVFFAGVIAMIAYFATGKPNMHDDPLAGRLEQLAQKPETELTGPEFLAIQEERARNSPRDPEPHKRIGDLYVAAGRTTDAMLNYTAALRRDPNYKPALDAVSELEFRSTGVVDQDTINRLPGIREQARANPESLTNVQLMALLQERAGQAPADAMPHKIMGRLLEGVGHADKAEAAYGEALKRDPKDVEALKSLADLKFKRTGKIEGETADLYRRAYSLDRKDLRIGYMAGIGDWVAGRQKEAKAQFAEIDARTPKDGPYPQMFAALRQMFGIDPPPPGAVPAPATPAPQTSPATPNKPG
jgi:cytochrome c-type biogenesis protein CcmH/NrfG